MATPTRQQAPAIPIPPLIKRNTFLLAAAQAFVGAGTQMVPTLGAIIVVRLLGSATLSGIGTSILGVSRFIAAYPTGRIADAYGRRLAMMVGMLISLVGTVITGLGVMASSFPIFVMGLFVFGTGMGAAQQLGVAAADMYPPSRRGTGLGWVLTGSLVGAMGGPLLIRTAHSLSDRASIDELALAWLLVPLVIVPGLILVSMVRPDPKQIAGDLQRYYPDYTPPVRKTQTAVAEKVTIMTFVRHYPKLTAFVASFAFQGNMSMLMAMTSLALHHHGHGVPAISLSVSIHVMGMFGLSLPLGKLTDKFGRRNLMLAGIALSIIGALLVPLTSQYWIITLGTFLVGVGWSCGNVAITALIADTTQAHERGRAVGVNGLFNSGSAIAMPLLGGVIAGAFGLPWVGALGVALMVAPLVLLLRLREPEPGKYQ